MVADDFEKEEELFIAVAGIAEEQAVGIVESRAVEGGSLEFFDVGGTEITLFQKLFGAVDMGGEASQVQVVVS